MSQLQDNLNEIKRQKEEVLTPNNVKKGVEYFGQVGTLEGGTVEGIKQFETIEEMQADTTAQEGDLAVVYQFGGETGEITTDTRFNKLEFLKNTGSISTAMYRRFNISSIDGTVHSYAGMMREIMINGPTWNLDIKYSSSGISRVYADGIEYEETEDGYIVDFGTECYTTETSAINKFCRLPAVNTFNGLYRYTEYVKEVQVNALTGSSTLEQQTYDIAPVDIKRTARLLLDNSLSSYVAIVYNPSTKSGKVLNTGMSVTGVVYNNKHYIGIADSLNSRSYHTADIDFNDYTITNIVEKTDYADLLNVGTLGYSNYSGYMVYEYNETDLIFVIYPYTDGRIGYQNIILSSNGTGSSVVSGSQYDVKAYEYLPAPTQLTLAEPGDLLPGKIGYGKNGVITGDESIYQNLNTNEVVSNILSVEPFDEKKTLYNPIPTKCYSSIYEVGKMKYITKTFASNVEETVQEYTYDYKQLHFDEGNRLLASLLDEQLTVGVSLQTNSEGKYIIEVCNLQNLDEYINLNTGVSDDSNASIYYRYSLLDCGDYAVLALYSDSAGTHTSYIYKINKDISQNQITKIYEKTASCKAPSNYYAANLISMGYYKNTLFYQHSYLDTSGMSNAIVKTYDFNNNSTIDILTKKLTAYSSSTDVVGQMMINTYETDDVYIISTYNNNSYYFDMTVTAYNVATHAKSTKYSGYYQWIGGFDNVVVNLPQDLYSTEYCVIDEYICVFSHSRKDGQVKLNVFNTAGDLISDNIAWRFQLVTISSCKYVFVSAKNGKYYLYLYESGSVASDYESINIVVHDNDYIKLPKITTQVTETTRLTTDPYLMNFDHFWFDGLDYTYNYYFNYKGSTMTGEITRIQVKYISILESELRTGDNCSYGIFAISDSQQLVYTPAMTEYDLYIERPPIEMNIPLNQEFEWTYAFPGDMTRVSIYHSLEYRMPGESYWNEYQNGYVDNLDFAITYQKTYMNDNGDLCLALGGMCIDSGADLDNHEFRCRLEYNCAGTNSIVKYMKINMIEVQQDGFDEDEGDL